MSEPITMPALSDTMSNGRLVKWVKKLGDAIKKGDTIAEVETDKAVMEVEAFHDGYLAGPLAAEGTEMPVGKVIGYIADSPGEAPAAVAQATPAAPKTAPPETVPCGRCAGGGGRGSEGRRGCGGQRRASSSREASGSSGQNNRCANPSSPQPSPQRGEDARSASLPAQSSSPLPAGERSAPKAPGEEAQTSHANRVSASPLARRLAKDSGVDLAGIQGSGPHGRIVAADVEAAKSRKGVMAPAAAEAAAPAGHGMSDQQIRALYPDRLLRDRAA